MRQVQKVSCQSLDAPPTPPSTSHPSPTTAALIFFPFQMLMALKHAGALALEVNPLFFQWEFMDCHTVFFKVFGPACAQNIFFFSSWPDHLRHSLGGSLRYNRGLPAFVSMQSGRKLRLYSPTCCSTVTADDTSGSLPGFQCADDRPSLPLEQHQFIPPPSIPPCPIPSLSSRPVQPKNTQRPSEAWCAHDRTETTEIPNLDTSPIHPASTSRQCCCLFVHR